jgi:hypothetical protein
MPNGCRTEMATVWGTKAKPPVMPKPRRLCCLCSIARKTSPQRDRAGALFLFKVDRQRRRPLGSKGDISAERIHVRFTAESRHCRTTVGCPLCARKRHMHRSKRCAWVSYSITSLARNSTDVGMVSASCLAVFEFTTNSKFAGPSIGKSPGTAPRRIRIT